MQLDELKPAWKQLKLLHSMQRIPTGEILSMIGEHDQRSTRKGPRVLLSLVLFIVMTLFFQGG